MIDIPDEGQTIKIGDGYKIDFSGDVCVALLPADKQNLFVEDFDEHIQYMEFFQKRWMPSNQARDIWLSHVRTLDIDMLCPQHGVIFKGENIAKFLDWFETLELGYIKYQQKRQG